MKRVYLATNGCGVLRHEANRILTYFLANGYEESVTAGDADDVLLIVCGMTNEDVDFGIGQIKKLGEETKRGARLIISGCFPAVEKIPVSGNGNIFVFTYDQLDALDKLICAEVPLKDVFYNVGKPDHLVWPKPEKSEEMLQEEVFARVIDKLYPHANFLEKYRYSTRGEYIWNDEHLFQIRAAYGCAYACSYCSSRISVGKFRSVDMMDILSQYRLGLSKGYRQFMLIGTELGNYGKDIGLNIVDLIKSMYEVDKTAKVGIRYIHPDCLVKYFDGLLPYMECGFISYFCAAIQTASTRLLKMMNRTPDLGGFIDCIRQIKDRKMPVHVHSQVMVGFPSETTEDILETMLLLEECKFDYVNVNIFSPRPMTPAARMDGQIPEDVKDFRFILMNGWQSKVRKDNLYEHLKSI